MRSIALLVSVNSGWWSISKDLIWLVKLIVLSVELFSRLTSPEASAKASAEASPIAQRPVSGVGERIFSDAGHISKNERFCSCRSGQRSSGVETKASTKAVFETSKRSRSQGPVL